MSERMNQSSLPPPWWILDSKPRLRQGLEVELKRETLPGHILDGKTAFAVAKCDGCDEVIFRIDNNNYARVHLMWSRGKSGEDPTYPFTTLLPTWRDVITNVGGHSHDA